MFRPVRKGQQRDEEVANDTWMIVAQQQKDVNPLPAKGEEVVRCKVGIGCKLLRFRRLELKGLGSGPVQPISG